MEYLLQAGIWHFSESLELLHVISEKENLLKIMNNHNSNSKVLFWILSKGLETWIALSAEFSGIVQGKSKDDDFGFVDTQPGLVDGQGLIFLQEK